MRNTRCFGGWYTEVFVEELLNKTVKMGLFILLKQDVGLAKIMRASSLFVQKKEGPL